MAPTAVPAMPTLTPAVALLAKASLAGAATPNALKDRVKALDAPPTLSTCPMPRHTRLQKSSAERPTEWPSLEPPSAPLAPQPHTLEHHTHRKTLVFFRYQWDNSADSKGNAEHQSRRAQGINQSIHGKATRHLPGPSTRSQQQRRTGCTAPRCQRRCHTPRPGSECPRTRQCTQSPVGSHWQWWSP